MELPGAQAACIARTTSQRTVPCFGTPSTIPPEYRIQAHDEPAHGRLLWHARRWTAWNAGRGVGSSGVSWDPRPLPWLALWPGGGGLLALLVGRRRLLAPARPRKGHRRLHRRVEGAEVGEHLAPALAQLPQDLVAAGRRLEDAHVPGGATRGHVQPQPGRLLRHRRSLVRRRSGGRRRPWRRGGGARARVRHRRLHRRVERAEVDLLPALPVVRVDAVR